MNKINISFICALLSIISCSWMTKVNTDNKHNIVIVQKESNLPTVIEADTTKNILRTISFRLVFEITNNEPDVIGLVSFDYLCQQKYIRKDYRKWTTVNRMFLYENNNLTRLRNSDSLRYFKKGDTKLIVFETMHTPSTDSVVQSLFTPYLEKMKGLKTNSLNIENIQELKSINPDFIYNFLEGDSIDVMYKQNKRFYYKLFPVELK